MNITIDEFLSLRHDHPVIDVRSEGEFEAGHMTGAVNLPLLNNTERVIVGTTYKQKGQREAIHEGFRLVGPRLESLVTNAERIAGGNEVLVYCWRGGMRSNNFCQFLSMARIRSRTLTGGYKAYRQRVNESFRWPLQITLLGGCTGGGKSEVLRALAANGEQVLDLEAMAHHKGSAFGGLLMPPQPTNEQFQNDLFEAILRLDLSRRIWIEDESLAIGKIFLPDDLWWNMRKSPLVVMEVDKKIRIDRLVSEYGPADRETFLEIMGKITKRLGGQNYKEAKEKLHAGDMASTIDILLTYYDKAYLESMDKRKELVQLRFAWDGKNADQYARSLIREVTSVAAKV